MGAGLHHRPHVGGLKAQVKLEPVADCAAIPRLPGEWNAGIVHLEDGRVFNCQGRGAGGPATAEAITADLFEIASEPRAVATAQIAMAV